MKFTVCMKTPDALYNGIHEVAQRHTPYDDMSDEELDQAKDRALECAKKWFKYGEYVWIEVDVEAGTATVLEL